MRVCRSPPSGVPRPCSRHKTELMSGKLCHTQMSRHARIKYAWEPRHHTFFGIPAGKTKHDKQAGCLWIREPAARDSDEVRFPRLWWFKLREDEKRFIIVKKTLGKTSEGLPPLFNALLICQKEGGKKEPGYKDLVSNLAAGRLTAVTVVVHQDDLLKQVCWRVVDHAVDGAQDHRQGLVDKDEDHGDLREVLGVRQLLAPVGGKKLRMISKFSLYKDLVCIHRPVCAFVAVSSHKSYK